MTAGVYERTTVGRPADANFGPLRARGPETVMEIRRLRDGGCSIATLAEEFGVHPRTIYRYLAAGERFYEVEIAGWVATFAKRPRHVPVRVSDWRRP